VRIWQRTHKHIQSCSWRRGCDSPPSLLRALSPRCSQIDFTTRFGSAPMACASHPQLTQHLLTLTLTLTLTHVPTSHNTYSRSLTYPPTHSLVHTNISNCALYPLLFLATYLLSVPKQHHSFVLRTSSPSEVSTLVCFRSTLCLCLSPPSTVKNTHTHTRVPFVHSLLEEHVCVCVCVCNKRPWRTRAKSKPLRDSSND
jgi:hypothetical protein